MGPLESGLRFLASDLALGAGAAIILFTIIVRVILLPLTLQQMRSQKAMAALQPEIKALQKKHGGDREKISVETMALYKEHGVNPAAGCFPILLQMPILFGLYAALSNLGVNDGVFQAPWLWVGKLDQPDIFHIANTPLPGVLPVLAAGTQWVQQKMMTQPTDDPQQRMQNSMMQFMPLMMLWFGLSFSAGLALYWVTQNVVGIVQQYFLTGWGSLFPDRVAAFGAKPAGFAKGASGTNGAGAAATTAARADLTDSAGARSGDRAGQRSGRNQAAGKRNERNERADGGTSRGGARGEGRRTSGKR